MPKPKAVLLTVILPAAAGIAAAMLLPDSAPPALPGSRTSPTASSQSQPTKALLPPAMAGPGSTTVPAEPKPSFRERIVDLCNQFRVEDLLAELPNLPPGDDRNLAIQKLAQRWFELDHAGTLKWNASLSEESEKQEAYS